jgi:hypothetical protein
LVTSPPGSTGSGKQKRVRLAEAFFRRWPVLLIPVVLLGALGAYQATKVSKTFKSQGSISVSPSKIGQINGDTTTGGFTLDTAAQTTAREINELMGTDAFANTVAQNAQLSDAVKSGQITLDKIRSYVTAGSAGDNIVRVASTTPYADLSEKLATSLILSYRDHVLSTETAGLNGAITFVTTELQAAQTRVDAANQAVDDYVKAHPSPVTGNRPDDEALQVSRLTDAVTSAQKQLDNIQSNLDQANLQLKQSQSDIDQRYQIVDTPVTPSTPESTKIKQLFAFVVFLILGLGIALAALVVMAMLDHSVRTNADINGVPGLKVLAAIPQHRTTKRKNSKRHDERPTSAQPGKLGA